MSGTFTIDSRWIMEMSSRLGPWGFSLLDPTGRSATQGGARGER